LLGGAQHAQTVELSHAQVGDDQVEAVALHQIDGILAAVGERHVVAGLLQRDAQEIPHAPFVVDDEHARNGHRVTTVPVAAGRTTTTLVPPPLPLRTLTPPPRSRTIRRARESPTPLPPAFAEKK